ncbi:hypothetical protein MMC11_003315 [Xylographa trunciseda]|nr:hypothetical protein [Xylographa trunciseda]
MVNQRSPDGRLVYLHCSSIFSGGNAHVRRAKKVVQLLEKHKTSIKILTNEFTIAAIAAVAKELLEERIFDSLPRAKLRYPELFQPSGTQEAERAASEAEVIRIEAEAVQEIELTSDAEGGDECLDFEQTEKRTEPEGTLKDKAVAGDNVQVGAVKLQQSTSQANYVFSIPKLHPVYLPYKTQHKVLVSVQSMLEECCLEFGNTWVPDLMIARKWNEAESIELTQWTKRFSKYVKSLPTSAIKPVPGKSIAEVLFGTSHLRHSAVHRLPTSAAGILNMLCAAVNFAEALNDSKRSKKVTEIKMQLEASIEEIIQHQNLLERKLTDQFEDIARRRAELDELERSSIEEMLATDKKQRTEIGSAFESFLGGSQPIPNSCTCCRTPSFDETKVDSEVGVNIESGGVEHELEPPTVVNDAQAFDQSPPSGEKPHQGEELEKYGGPPYQNNSSGNVKEEPEDSDLALSTFRSKGQNKEANFATSLGRDSPEAQEAPVLVDAVPTSEDASLAPVQFFHNVGWKWPQHGASNFDETGSVAAEPHDAPEEAIPAEEPCFDVTVEAFPSDEPYIVTPDEEPCFAAQAEPFPSDEPYIITPEEEPLPDDTFPTEEAISRNDLMETEMAAPEATLESLQAEPIIDVFDSAEEPHNLDDPYEPTQKPDVAPIHNVPVRNAEFLISPPRPALCAGCDESNFHSRPPLAPISTVTSVPEAAVPEAAVPEAPTKDSHIITVEIVNGSEILRTIVLINACTRTAILNEARAYCVRYAPYNQSLRELLLNGWDLVLVSLEMYGYDMDLSSHKVENLSSLVRTVEKSGVPRFTLRISETIKVEVCS